MPYKDPQEQKEYFQFYDKFKRDPIARKLTSKTYYDKNKEIILAKDKIRRDLAKLNAPPKLPRQPKVTVEIPLSIKNLRARENIYGTSYAQIWEDQGGKCPICFEPLYEDESRNEFDHSHDTGQVRGLLHRVCNDAIGKFNDNVESLKRAVVYLEAPPKYGVIRASVSNRPRMSIKGFRKTSGIGITSKKIEELEKEEISGD
jgi:hypothetical protein